MSALRDANAIPDDVKLQRSLLRAVDDLYAKFRAIAVFDNPDSTEESREVAIATLTDGTQANIIRGWCDYLFERKDPGEAFASASGPHRANRSTAPTGAHATGPKPSTG